jgi:hypothetical protein
MRPQRRRRGELRQDAWGSCDSIYPAAIIFGKYFAYFGQGAAMEDRKETMSFNV